MTYYCSSPFSSLFINVDGGVKTCCAGSYELGNLHQDSIESVLNGQKLKDIQQAMKEGEIPSYCSGCKKSEELIGHSQRSYFQMFEDTEEFELRSVDIRWNNTCNISCTYCDEKFSSTWAKKKVIPISSRLPYHKNMLEYLIANASKIKTMILGGGEPLLHKDLLPFVKALPEDCKIDVMTNFGVDFTDYPFAAELLRRNTYFNISIENIGEQVEYVRNEIDWNVIVSNLNKVKGRDQTPSFLSLYNIYSCTRISDIMKFAHEQGCNITWQNLMWPEHLQVFKFSDAVKDLAIAELEKCRELPKPAYTVEETERFIEETIRSLKDSKGVADPIDKKFLEYTLEFDEKFNGSKKSFAELWPELWSILNGR